MTTTLTKALMTARKSGDPTALLDAVDDCGSVEAAVKADPAVVGELHRLFAAKLSPVLFARLATGLASFAKSGASPKGWPRARERILDATLERLHADVSPGFATSLVRAHEGLMPTAEERSLRAKRYLDLLGSSVPNTVAFALEALADIHGAGALPARAFIDEAPQALAVPTKTAARRGARVLADVAGASTKLRGACIGAALDALARGVVADAQAILVSLVIANANRADEAFVTRVRAALPLLVPSARRELESWLGARAESGTAKAAAPARGQAALFDRARALNASLAELAGVPEALAAVESGRLVLSPQNPSPLSTPRLDPAARVTPITDSAELVDAMSRLIEHPDDADLLERVLDGVSRLCDLSGPDFDRVAGPLRKRVAKQVKREMPWAASVMGFAARWLKIHTDSGNWGRPAGVGLYYYRRMVAIAMRAKNKAPRALLAAPTHAGGFLDARVLVDRARDVRAQLDEEGIDDAALALLRLAPDHRPAALTAAKGIAGELGAAIRHALGGPGETVGPTAALWIAAARARCPGATDAAVAARFGDLGPDAAEASAPVFAWTPFGRGRWPLLRASRTAVPLPAKVPPAHLTVLFHVPYPIGVTVITVGEAHAWRVLWPSDRAAWFCEGATRLGENLNDAHCWENHVFLEPIFDPGVAMDSMALACVAFALAAKQPREAGLGVDAAIATIADGRMTGATLGDALAKAYGAFAESQHRYVPKITAARWAKALARVAAASPLHALSVREALSRVLALDPANASRDVASILELYFELLVAADAGVVSEATRSALSGYAGGKAGALAKKILALPPRDGTDGKAAALAALEGRIARAERWHAMRVVTR